MTLTLTIMIMLMTVISQSPIGRWCCRPRRAKNPQIPPRTKVGSAPRRMRQATRTPSPPQAQARQNISRGGWAALLFSLDTSPHRQPATSFTSSRLISADAWPPRRLHLRRRPVALALARPLARPPLLGRPCNLPQQLFPSPRPSSVLSTPSPSAVVMRTTPARSGAGPGATARCWQPASRPRSPPPGNQAKSRCNRRVLLARRRQPGGAHLNQAANGWQGCRHQRCCHHRRSFSDC